MLGRWGRHHLPAAQPAHTTYVFSPRTAGFPLDEQVTRRDRGNEVECSAAEQQ